MPNQKFEYVGKCYQYVLPLLDVFPRSNWFFSLERKNAYGVKVEWKKIRDVHGILDLLQRDSGKKFESSVSDIVKKVKFGW